VLLTKKLETSFQFSETVYSGQKKNNKYSLVSLH